MNCVRLQSPCKYVQVQLKKCFFRRSIIKWGCMHAKMTILLKALLVDPWHCFINHEVLHSAYSHFRGVKILIPKSKIHQNELKIKAGFAILRFFSPPPTSCAYWHMEKKKTSMIQLAYPSACSCTSRHAYQVHKDN